MRYFSPLLAIILVAKGSFLYAALTLDDYRAEYAQREQQYEQQLVELANALQQRAEVKAVQHLRELIEQSQDDTLRIERLPKQVREPLPAALPADRLWEKQLRLLQEAEAVELYKLSRKAMNDNHISFAYRMLREAARLNPDYEVVRKLLGYIRQGDEWLTPFEADKKNKGEVWDDRFGWIKKDDLPRYERGERPLGSRWVPAVQERELRRDFRAAWVIRTEHWLVKTNHSLEKGVEIAKKLEEYYEFFISEFPGLFNNRSQMRKLFAMGGNSRPRINRNPFVVHYYKDKDDFVGALVRRYPMIKMTNGLYDQDDEISYFYFDKQANDESSLYHEATHQILFESRAVKRDIAQENHFWVIEGFACYMESFENDRGVIALGDPDFIRFNNARTRLIADNLYYPLSSVCQLGRKEFQAVKNLPALYSQSSGLVHFFLHADDGKYRDAFIEYMAEIYASRSSRQSDVPTLEKLTGRSHPQLDKEYILYINRQVEELAREEEKLEQVGSK